MSIPKKPITKNGYEILAKEFHHLKDVERPKVVAGVATAAAEGDRSENAEYIYGKKRLREIDKRLRYLTGLLTDTQIIDPETLSGEVVCFGSTVTIKTEAGDHKEYMIVGVGETFSEHFVSWQSAMGKALLGKKVGATVEMENADGEVIRTIEIVNLKFGSKHA